MFIQVFNNYFDMMYIEYNKHNILNILYQY
jgi:hypothetical protein